MATSALTATLQDLSRRIESGYPILLLRTHEERRWENLLADLALELERGLVTWSLTAGPCPKLGNDDRPPDVVEFLSLIERYPNEHLFLLKDLHPALNQPAVIRKLRDMIPVLALQKKTLLLISPVDSVPVELQKELTVLEMPLPGPDELRGTLQAAISSFQNGKCGHLSPRQEDRLIQAVLGLTEAEASRAFRKVFSDVDEFNDDILPMLVAEKRHLIQGSHLLEFFDLDEGLDAIGGLDGLKSWVQQRANAFTSEAKSQGISNPRGVLLAGVQGCGKSLSARVIARILGFPLIRLDIGTLLESSRGGSEQNLRDVLQLLEMIAPAVLWLEEIDKAFAGFDEEANIDSTLSRLVGRFLTWLQEHAAPVFVVATANNISRLPPEMLRRGRFDELFFVDLPNYYERLEIFRIHLAKRGWKPDKFDIEELAEDSNGYSGAEIEEIVNSAVIEAHALNRVPTQQDLEQAKERTVPLSVTMEDEIFHLREWARTRCRPATQDFRIMQVMEEEQRKGEVIDLIEVEQPRWKQLAEHGQIQAAIYSFIETNDNVPWATLLKEFEPYLETRGEYGLVIRSNPKIVLCVRLSRDMADIIAEYLHGRRIYLHPAATELIPESAKPTLPAIEEIPEETVNSPVWLPTIFRILPHPGKSGQLARVARIRMGK